MCGDVEPAARDVRLRRQAEAGQRPRRSATTRELREARRVVRRVRLLRRRGLRRLPVEPPAPAVAPRPPARRADRRRRRVAAAASAPSSRRARIGYCEQHETHHSSGSGTHASPTPGVSHARGHDVDPPDEHAARRRAIPQFSQDRGRSRGVSLPGRRCATGPPVGSRRRRRVPCRHCREPSVPWTVEVAEMAASTTRDVTAPGVAARKGRRAPARDGHGLRRAVGADRRRRRRRHDPRRRLARDGRARLRRHAAGHDRRHGAPRRRGRAHAAATRSSSATCRGSATT